MKNSQNIIERVKGLQERKLRDWQWGDDAATHFDSIAEALLIAVEALKDAQTAGCDYGCDWNENGTDADHNPRCKRMQDALSRISSL